MRIVFSCDYYSANMGYHENNIPKYLAKLGHEVYVISSTYQIYGDCDFYDKTYKNYLGEKDMPPGESIIDGVKLIRLKRLIWWKRFKIVKGRIRLIRSIKPDIVYAYETASFQVALLSFYSFFSNYKLFTATHTVASVYPAYYKFKEWNIFKKVYLFLSDSLFGFITNLGIDICYAMTPDGLEISKSFFKISSKKLKLISLPIDTDLFYPLQSIDDSNKRKVFRDTLKISELEILCIYTGRLTNAKNPYCLALAIKILRNNGYPVRAIFFGEGEQANNIMDIDGCIVKPFTNYNMLPDIYRSADIGVWPRQESLSMNDAAACGLPLIVSNNIKALERINGNGLTYMENDSEDLAKQILKLLDKDLRNQMGLIGFNKISQLYSCKVITEIYLKDFKNSLI